MGVTLPDFTDGTEIESAGIRSKFNSIEEYLNGGIVQGDLANSRWVGPQKIYKPDFYGSPAPRMEAQSGDTHYRHVGDSRSERAVFHGDLDVKTYRGIPGLCATVKNPYTQTLRADIVANFFVWEDGGFNAFSTNPPFAKVAARFAIFVDGSVVPGTERRMYNSVRSETDARLYARQQIGTIASVSLSPGVHQVGIYCRVEEPLIASGGGTAPSPGDPGVADGDPEWNSIWVQCRNLIVDMHALHS